MATQKNCTLVAAAYSLGVDVEALESFVNQHRPIPGMKASNDDTVFKVGDEMARVIDGLNPELAKRWRIVNYITSKQRR